MCPREASTGDYLGTITIGNGQGTEATLQVSLHVADWSMPQASERKFHLDLWQFPVTVLNRYNDSNPGRTIDVWSEEHLCTPETPLFLPCGIGPAKCDDLHL